MINVLAFLCGYGFSKVAPLLLGVQYSRVFGHESYATLLQLIVQANLLVSISTIGYSQIILTAGDCRQRAFEYSFRAVCFSAFVSIIGGGWVAMMTPAGMNWTPTRVGLAFAPYSFGTAVLGTSISQSNAALDNSKSGTLYLVGSAAPYFAGMLSAWIGLPDWAAFQTIAVLVVLSSLIIYVTSNWGFLTHLSLGQVVLLSRKSIPFEIDQVFSILFTGSILLAHALLVGMVVAQNSPTLAAAFGLGYQLYAVGIAVPGVLGQVVVPRLIHHGERTSLTTPRLAFLYAAIALIWMGIVWLASEVILTVSSLPVNGQTLALLRLLQGAAVLGAVNALVYQKLTAKRDFGSLAFLGVLYSIVLVGFVKVSGASGQTAAIGFLVSYTATIVAGILLLRRRTATRGYPSELPRDLTRERPLVVYIFGRRPPPVGGCTVHTDRLINWLSDSENVAVKHVDVTVWGLVRFTAQTVCSRGQRVVFHCHTSSVLGLPILLFLKLLSPVKVGVIHSIHSDLWIKSNVHCGGLRGFMTKYCLARLDLLIADSGSILREALPYVSRAKVVEPFLPPRGTPAPESLSRYLGLPPFDAPAVVFNAYKLVSMPDGSDLYGLDILLDAYKQLDMPLTLVLLIPQITRMQIQMIRTTVESGTRERGNLKRVHIVSDPTLEGWQAIAKADVFVRPTRTDADAISVREAVWFGVPTVASDCDVRPPQVLQFRSGDAAALADKIRLALTSPSRNLHGTDTQPKLAENPVHPFLEAYRSVA